MGGCSGGQYDLSARRALFARGRDGGDLRLWCEYVPLCGTFKLIFFLFLGLFLFTLVLGYLPQGKPFSDLEQAKTEEQGSDGK